MTMRLMILIALLLALPLRAETIVSGMSEMPSPEMPSREARSFT